MRLVVDNSAYSSGLVEQHLSACKRNQIIQTDYASIEAYKGADLQSLFEQTALLARFPGQVIVLKDTKRICGLRGRRAGLTRRMIDEYQTQNFPSFCRDVALARAGDVHYLRQLQNNAAIANSQALEWSKNAARIADGIYDITQALSPAERGAVRGGNVPDILREKLIRTGISLATLLIEKHPTTLRRLPPSEVVNTLPLRASMLLMILAIDWISVGRTQRSPESMRNDLIDACVAAYATFFDGILTADTRQLGLYSLLPSLLR